jgi:Actin
MLASKATSKVCATVEHSTSPRTTCASIMDAAVDVGRVSLRCGAAGSSTPAAVGSFSLCPHKQNQNNSSTKSSWRDLCTAAVASGHPPQMRAAGAGKDDIDADRGFYALDTALSSRMEAAAAAVARVLAPRLQKSAAATGSSSAEISSPAVPPNSVSASSSSSKQREQKPFRIVVSVPALDGGARRGFAGAIARHISLTAAASAVRAVSTKGDGDQSSSFSSSSSSEYSDSCDIRVLSSEACAAAALLLLDEGASSAAAEAASDLGLGPGSSQSAAAAAAVSQTVSQNLVSPLSRLGLADRGTFLLVDVGAFETRALPVIHGALVPSVAGFAERPLASARVGGAAVAFRLLDALEGLGRIPAQAQAVVPDRGEEEEEEEEEGHHRLDAWLAVAMDIVERSGVCTGEAAVVADGDHDGGVESNGDGDGGGGGDVGSLAYTLPSSLVASSAAEEATDGDAPATPVVMQIPAGLVSRCLHEVLFAGWSDADGRALPHVVLDSLLDAPVDARAALARNIILVGGAGRVPGLAPRLALALAELLSAGPHESPSASAPKLATMDARDVRRFASPLGGLVHEVHVASSADPGSEVSARSTALQAPHLSWLGASLLASLDEFWASESFALAL